jgi:hypothetical protein
MARPKRGKAKSAAAPAKSTAKKRVSKDNDENVPPEQATRQTRSAKKHKKPVEEPIPDDDVMEEPNAQVQADDEQLAAHRRARRAARDGNDTDDDDGVDDEEAYAQDEEEESDDDDVEEDQKPPAKPRGMSNEQYIRALQRQTRELQQVQERAIATATATKKVQNKELLKKVDECVKTKVWRTCKFITSHSIQEKATIFVLTNVPEFESTTWSAEDWADYVLTYKGAVGTSLNDKRNYAQSQMREVVLDFCMHRIDPQGRRVTGQDRMRDSTQPAETPASEIRMVMRPPLVMFRMGLIEKAITR